MRAEHFFDVRKLEQVARLIRGSKGRASRCGCRTWRPSRMGNSYCGRRKATG